MDEHIDEYYSQSSDQFPEGNFHSCIALHEAADVDWETVSKKVPILSRGWYELSQLFPKDRVQFSLDYWLTKLPYHPHVDEHLTDFFGALDDIGIFLIQKNPDDPFDVNMAYSLRGNRGFYRGNAPANEVDLIDLQKLFPNYILPEDYLAFLQIHDGFCKTTDCTGITSSKNINQRYQEFQELLEGQDTVKTRAGKVVEPQSLIPFYESFGMPYYQCFWAEWYPKQEMGNVYYSASENTISDPLSLPTISSEHMAFPTFLDWLFFYLEQIET